MAREVVCDIDGKPVDLPPFTLDHAGHTVVLDLCKDHAAPFLAALTAAADKRPAKRGVPVSGHRVEPFDWKPAPTAK